MPGVVQYLAYFFDDYFVYIVLKKIRKTIDLYDFITKHNGKINESLTKSILKQLISILLNCKSKGVCHNDIKETNILIDPLSKEITLIDFDAAEEWTENCIYTKYRGTWQYSCPEWQVRGCYTPDDMCSWSIGVLMYSMLCGTLPFNSPTQIIYDDLPENTVTFMSPSAFTFLRRCLDKNNAYRIKIQDMHSAPWFQESLT